MSFAGVAGSSAAATAGLYPDPAARATAANLINAAPGLVALYGRIYDPTSWGAVSLIKLVGVGTALVGLVGVLTVIRHTRADEETGRRELLAAGAVGRNAPLAAGLLTASLGSLLIGLLTAGALAVVGLPLIGSAAFGLSWAVAGLAFTAVGAIAAQATVTARAARELGAAILVLGFVLRAVGDITGTGEPAWPTWLSPIGWSQQIRPYAGERWWVAGVSLAFAGVAMLTAFVLMHRRDLGSGLLPQRPGAARAARSLSSTWGLSWRLHRNRFLGWLAVFTLFSLVIGQILPQVGDLLSTPESRRFVAALGGPAALTDAFLSLELNFVAVAAAIYGMSTVLRLGDEEATLRADFILTSPAPRWRWFASHLLIASLGTAALMTLAGLAIGVVQAVTADPATGWTATLGAAVARIPVIWLIVMMTFALYGVARRAAPLAWTLLAAMFVVSEVGPLLDLPAWLHQLSPLTHFPALPGGAFAAGPMMVVVAVAAAFGAAGWIALTRRDLAGAR